MITAAEQYRALVNRLEAIQEAQQNYRIGANGELVPQDEYTAGVAANDTATKTAMANAADGVNQGAPAQAAGQAAKTQPAKPAGPAPVAYDTNFPVATAKELQKKLNAAGEKLVVDGKMGPATRAAMARHPEITTDPNAATRPSMANAADGVNQGPGNMPNAGTDAQLAAANPVDPTHQGANTTPAPGATYDAGVAAAATADAADAQGGYAMPTAGTNAQLAAAATTDAADGPSTGGPGMPTAGTNAQRTGIRPLPMSNPQAVPGQTPPVPPRTASSPRRDTPPSTAPSTSPPTTPAASGPGQASQTAPGTPAPAQPTFWNKFWNKTAPKPGAQTPAQQLATGGRAMEESVSYRDEQTLARIIQLARHR